MSDTYDLSPRELQIARAYAAGDTYHVIAKDLCIAPSTVRTHLATIYRTLEVSSKLELLARLRGDATAARDHTEMGVTLAELALGLEEANSRERALSEVLRIISRSHGDIDTVMPSILPYALELCDAEFGILFEYTTDAKFRSSFTLGIPDAFQFWLDEQGGFTARPETGLGLVEAFQGVVNINDVRAEAIHQTERTLRYATTVLRGARSFVALPMHAAERPVGAFTI